MILCPGRECDLIPFRLINRNLPEGSTIYGDSGYVDYVHQDQLMEIEKVKLVVEPKSNSLRSIDLYDLVNLKHSKKFIEGIFGVLSRLLPRKIHSTTASGFEIKILCFFSCSRK